MLSNQLSNSKSKCFDFVIIDTFMYTETNEFLEWDLYENLF